MKNSWTSIKKNNKLVLFIGVIMIIGLISGAIYYNFLDENILNNINSNISNLTTDNLFSINHMIIHLFIISLLIIMSFFGVGFILGLFFLFFEFFSVGFNIATYTAKFKIGGLIYGIIYNLIVNGIFVIILFCLLIKLFDISRKIVGYLIYKNIETKELIFSKFWKCIKYILFLIISDIFLLIFGSKIIHVFFFLINK